MNIRRLTLTTLVITAVGLTACSSESKRSIDSGSATFVGDSASTLLTDAATLPAGPPPMITMRGAIAPS